MAGVTRVVILGGGPGGYEAALVAAQLGAEVAVVDRDGLGGSAVLTDCVPSKTLIATAEVMTLAAESGGLGVRLAGADPDVEGGAVGVDLAAVNARVKRLALAQSARHPQRGSRAEGVRLVEGAGRLDRAVRRRRSAGERLEADAVLVATGARPRVVPGAEPDGERILTWTQVYDLAETAREADRRRVRGHRCRVRVGLPRARVGRRARLLAGPRAARRGRRRGRGARGRPAAPRA